MWVCDLRLRDTIVEGRMGVEISFSPHCAASRCPSGVHSWLITEGERGGEGDEGDEGKRHSWGVALSDRGGVKVVVMVVDWGGGFRG